MAKLQITLIRSIVIGDDRTVTVHADDVVRGDVSIKLSEDDARWFWASLDPKVKQWREEDDDA